MKPRCLILFICPMLAALMASQPAPAAITTGDLVREMTDLEALTRFPAPVYTTFQFASYDRTSIEPYQPGWYANSDGFGGEPHPNFMETLVEPGEDGIGVYLLADVEGPGAIVRTWTPNPNGVAGNLKVYFDGGDVPFYDGSDEDFWRLRFGKLSGREGDLYTEGFSQNNACYFPIPFAKGLRAVWTGNIKELHFYHFEVRRYEPGTEVQTFTLKDLEAYKDEIQAAQTVLAAADFNEAIQPAGERLSAHLSLEPGKADALFLLDQPGAVTQLTLSLKAADLPQMLRQVILEGYFDDASRPQVESPLGDFFCSAPGVVPQQTLPISVAPDGTMTCRFVMPFARNARFVLINTGNETADIDGTIHVTDTPWDPDRSMHFYAKWRVNHGLIAGSGEDAIDLPFLNARGKGVFVGAASIMHNSTPVVTGGGGWWGEGDEKIWVDDDTFPSFFGTGSEDYYNYSWGRNTLFDHAYCGQPLSSGPGCRGFVVNNRFHIIDPIPFAKNIGFYMELLHHSRTPGYSYARIAYFYAFPGVRDDSIRIAPPDLAQGNGHPEKWQPVAMEGQDNTVFHQAEDVLDEGQAHASIVADNMWANGKMVLWQPEAVDDTLDFTLDVAEDGDYSLFCTLAHMPGSAVIGFSIDGKALDKPEVDLHEPHLTLLRTATTAPVTLSQGKHRVSIRALGHNPESEGSTVGVDFFWLVP